jgi:hypothetical protein
MKDKMDFTYIKRRKRYNHKVKEMCDRFPRRLERELSCVAKEKQRQLRMRKSRRGLGNLE